MKSTIRCRHLTNQDLYRTILLEEGCDVDASQASRPKPASRTNGVTVYSAESAHWVPRFRVMFGESLAG